MITTNKCVSCGNNSIGTTYIQESGQRMHGCNRCYPEDFNAMAERQKSMWLAGADEDEIATAQ